MKKVLILFIDAGGGHLASAKALAKAFAYKYGDEVAVQIVDVFKEVPFRPAQQIDETYRWLTGDGVWMWKAFWKTDGKEWVPNVLSKLLKPLLTPTLIQIFQSEKPDLVVSVHGLLNHVPSRILREDLHSNIPFITVVTDLVTAHPFWFCSEVDYCIVPTESARDRGIRYGMDANRIQVLGQPVDIDFAKSLGNKQEMRKKLGVEVTRPCILIMGGGDGMGRLYEIALAIESAAPETQMIIVAGRNPHLKARLEDRDWAVPTKIYGFTDLVPSLMSASDILITKGGPGSIAEALIAGVPIIISSYIPGQEIGNVEYVIEHDVGVYLSEPSEIADTAHKWLAPGFDRYDLMVTNARKIARPNASLEIVERLYQFLSRKEIVKPLD